MIKFINKKNIGLVSLSISVILLWYMARYADVDFNGGFFSLVFGIVLGLIGLGLLLSLPSMRNRVLIALGVVIIYFVAMNMWEKFR